MVNSKFPVGIPVGFLCLSLRFVVTFAMAVLSTASSQTTGAVFHTKVVGVADGEDDSVFNAVPKKKDWLVSSFHGMQLSG